MSTKQEAEPITDAELAQTSGGLKWEGRRESYNVEDRRPDAPPQWRQTLNTWWNNFKNGYLY
jgi:hypothetical protein